MRKLTGHEFYCNAIENDDFLCRFLGLSIDEFVCYDDAEIEDMIFNTFAQMPEEDYTEFENELLAR